jgi:protein translocase SecG subunit
METLVLTIHILIALGLVITVLLQRSEGGGLGIGGGGGGGGGGFMTARGTAHLPTHLGRSFQQGNRPRPERGPLSILRIFTILHFVAFCALSSARQ